MLTKTALTLVVVLLSVGAAMAQGADSETGKDLREIQREIQRIKQHEYQEEERIKADKARNEKLIQELEHRVQVIEGQNLRLKNVNSELQVTNQKLQQLQQLTKTQPSVSDFSNRFSRYLGSHTFTVTGAACRYRKLDPNVFMVQSSEKRQRGD